MRTLSAVASLSFLVQSLAFGGQVKGTCEHAFEANFESGGKLRMDIRSGDIEVTGKDTQLVRVWCELKRPEREKDIAIRFDSAAGFGDLKINGGPNRFARRTQRSLLLPRRKPVQHRHQLLSSGRNRHLTINHLLVIHLFSIEELVGLRVRAQGCSL